MLVPLYVIAVNLGLHNTFTGMIIVYAAWQAPMAVWISKGFFETIPREIEEAARIDGCSSLRIFIQIMLPLGPPRIGIGGAAVVRLHLERLPDCDHIRHRY